MASIPNPIPTKLLPRSPSLSPSPLSRSVLLGDVSGFGVRSRRARCYRRRSWSSSSSSSSSTSLVRAVLELEGAGSALKGSDVPRLRGDDRSKVLDLFVF